MELALPRLAADGRLIAALTVGLRSASRSMTTTKLRFVRLQMFPARVFQRAHTSYAHANSLWPQEMTVFDAIQKPWTLRQADIDGTMSVQSWFSRDSSPATVILHKSLANSSMKWRSTFMFSGGLDNASNGE